MMIHLSRNLTGRQLVIPAMLFCFALCSVPGMAQTAPPAAKPKAQPAAAAKKPAAPKPAAAKVPDNYKVKFETSAGDFTVEVHRDWAPLGADRFYRLVKNGFYNDARFFRVLPNFVAQFGIAGNPAVNAKYKNAKLKDDPLKHTNALGTITFATAGPNTRTTQVFISLRDNKNLDSMGFAPFGEVVQGMGVVTRLYGGYGEGAPEGQGPRQDLADSQGNAYMAKKFPKLDYIKKATIEQ